MDNNHLREDKESEEEIHAEAIESEEAYNKRKAEAVKHIIGDLEHFIKRPAEEWGSVKDDEYMLTDIMGLLNNSVQAYLSGNIPDYQG